MTALAVALFSPAAKATGPRAVAPAGGGLDAVEARIDAEAGALRVRSCKATDCSDAGGAVTSIAIPIDRSRLDLGGASMLFLSHADDVADHEVLRRELGCRRVMHRADVRAGTSGVEVKIAARPVAPNWRDEYKGLLVQPSTNATGGDGAPDQLVPRRPGRPAWTRELYHARYREARDRTNPPHANAAIAANLEMLDRATGTDPDYLRKLVQRFGLPPA